MRRRARVQRPGDGSAIRRALLWWFKWPGNPYVTVNFAVDFAPALAYLDAFPGEKPTVNHLVAAAIGRALGRYPQANARIVGNRILRPKHVGIAMMVNLVGHADARELGVALLDRAETLTLRQVAEKTRARVAEERTGRAANPVIRRLTKVVEAAPQAVVEGTLGLLDRAMRRQTVAERLYAAIPFTTALSNAGAAIGDAPGMLFRGADLAIPQRLVHVGTFWGLSALQDEVVAVDGAPAVRPMLPVLLLFDHRLVDGVLASRLVTTFGAILRDPAKEFGEDGTRPPSGA